MPSPSLSGQPARLDRPATFGQESSLSRTPSPSLSGHPLLAANPATLGQVSLLSTIPSPSLSGQPSCSFTPGTFGQASLLSAIPSPSASGIFPKGNPTTSPKDETKSLLSGSPALEIPSTKSPVVGRMLYSIPTLIKLSAHGSTRTPNPRGITKLEFESPKPESSEIPGLLATLLPKFVLASVKRYPRPANT